MAECNVCASFDAVVEKTGSQISEQQRHIRDKEITREIKSQLKIKVKSNDRVNNCFF